MLRRGRPPRNRGSMRGRGRPRAGHRRSPLPRGVRSPAYHGAMAPGMGPDAGALDTDPVDAPRPAGPLPAADEPAGAYRSPLLALPGAVAATGVDAGMAWHYGDPIAEQRAAEPAGRAVRPVAPRRSSRSTGADRLTWLHTLTSQHLSELTDGRVHRGAGAVPAGPRRAPLRGHRTRRSRLPGHRARAAGPRCWATWTACGSGRRWRSPTRPPISRCCRSPAPAAR